MLPVGPTTPVLEPLTSILPETATGPRPLRKLFFERISLLLVALFNDVILDICFYIL
jgi:hypothetical protein